MRVLSAAIAAIPFVFGAIRALQTGNDFRYLAAALAALAAAAAAFRLGRSTGRPTVSRALLALTGATLLAGGVSFGLGARSSVAVWVVALAFALCVTAAGMLGLFASSGNSTPPWP